MRNLPAFSRFLEVAALCNTSTINYSKIANESSIPASSVQNYFEILKDTLLISELPVWQKNKRRKPASTPKFLFLRYWSCSKFTRERFKRPSRLFRRK